MKETTDTWEKMKTLTSASQIEDFIENHFSDSLDTMMLDSGTSGEAE
jgi:16S rRNA G527 N7-methylase RsmG